MTGAGTAGCAGVGRNGSVLETSAPERALRSVMTAAGHDLMQPLQIISHALERVAARDQRKDDRIWLEAALVQVERLASGLSQLVEAGVSGEAAPLPSPQCLGIIMEESRAAWEKSATARDMTLEITPVPVRVRTDRARMRSILDNLIGNALKYGRSRVRVCTTGGPGEIRLDVTNDGDVIPGDVRERLFDAFYQADGSREGIGLGLSIVHGHCSALGHRIEFASDAEGTRFSVVIDRADG